MQAKTDFSPRFNGLRADHDAPCTDAARPGVFDCQSAALGTVTLDEETSRAAMTAAAQHGQHARSRPRRQQSHVCAECVCLLRVPRNRAAGRAVARSNDSWHDPLTRLILRVATSSRFIVESPPGGAARDQFSNSPVGDGPVTASERPAPRGNQIDVRICLDCRPARSQ